MSFTKQEFEEVAKQAVNNCKNRNLQNQTFFQHQTSQQQTISTLKEISTSSVVHKSQNGVANCCYEFNLNEIKGFKNLEKELEIIKIKPDEVDLHLFNEAFRWNDFNFASVSPDSEEFQAQYTEIMKQNNNIDLKLSKYRYFLAPSFHLINLDDYVEDKLYEDYFRSKVRIVKTLKNFFEADVKLTGSFWYPPHAYRLWHTNEDCLGWRMYLVDFDQPELAADGKSFFRYMHPETKELVTLADRPKLVRFFKIDNQPGHLLWHCIVNGTKANRWSYGFHVPDNWMEKIKLV